MDKKLLQLISDQDDELSAELRRLARNYGIVIRRHSRGDKLNDTEKIILEVVAVSSIFAVALAALLKKYSSKATAITLGDQISNIVVPLVKKAPSPEAEIVSLRRLVARETQNVERILLARRFPGTKETVSDRIKTLTNGSARTVRNIIIDGEERGLGSFEIAKRIEKYVIPDPKGLRVAPWTLARRLLGKPVSYIPRGIPAGSVSYNALRIARTETAFTYQQAPQKAFSDLWYIEGYLWKLSRSHPGKDLCDQYAAHDEGLGKGVWRRIPKIPHPHCLCRTSAATLDDDRFFEELKRRKDRL